MSFNISRLSDVDLPFGVAFPDEICLCHIARASDRGSPSVLIESSSPNDRPDWVLITDCVRKRLQYDASDSLSTPIAVSASIEGIRNPVR